MKRNESFNEITDMLLPQAPEVEHGVLGALVAGYVEADEVVGILCTDDFYLPVHQIIYQKIIEFCKAGEKIDLLSVATALGKHPLVERAGGFAFLSSLSSDTSYAYNINNHCLIIREMYILREAVKFSREIQRDAFNKTDVGDLIGMLGNGVDKISELTTLNCPINHVGCAVKKALEEVDIRQKTKQDGMRTSIPTGLKELDGLIGGWQKGDLVVIAGRPAMGKTALMLHFAKVAAQNGFPVCLYSLEMSDVSLANRLLLSECDIDFVRFRDGMMTDDELMRLHRSAGKIEQLPIYVNDTPAISMQGIRRNAIKMKRKGQCGLIMVDYLQLTETDGKDKNRTREQEVSAITRQAKIMAKELNVPLILLSQLSRNVEGRTDKYPKLSDLRESGSIEQDADVVGFVYRPAYYGLETVRTGNGHISTEGLGIFGIEKQRNGATGNIKFRHNPAMTQIRDYGSHEVEKRV